MRFVERFRARRQDAAPHPLIERIVAALEAQPWVDRASVRMRDMGQVFHVEAFVVPRRHKVAVDQIETARERISALDSKVQDVVVVVVPSLPDEASRV